MIKCTFVVCPTRVFFWLLYFLNDIDLILLNNSDLKPDDLPWLNPDKHEENWEKVIRELRLIIGKFVYEKNKRDRVVH